MFKVGALLLAACSLGFLGYQAILSTGALTPPPAPAPAPVTIDEVQRLAAQLAPHAAGADTVWGTAPRALVEHGAPLTKRGGFFAGSTASPALHTPSKRSTSSPRPEKAPHRSTAVSRPFTNNGNSPFAPALNRRFHNRTDFGFNGVVRKTGGR